MSQESSLQRGRALTCSEHALKMLWRSGCTSTSCLACFFIFLGLFRAGALDFFVALSAVIREKTKPKPISKAKVDPFPHFRGRQRKGKLKPKAKRSERKGKRSARRREKALRGRVTFSCGLCVRPPPTVLRAPPGSPSRAHKCTRTKEAPFFLILSDHGTDATWPWTRK